MFTAGKYFKPELSFRNSCGILLLPRAKLTHLTLRADVEAVCNLTCPKGPWGSYLYSHILAPRRGCPWELLTYMPGSFQSTVTSTQPTLPAGAAYASELYEAFCRLSRNPRAWRPGSGLKVKVSRDRHFK